jgi:hypothetical protein
MEGLDTNVRVRDRERMEALMTFVPFLRRLARHVLMALIAFVAIVIAAERLMPGFAMPFFDVMYVVYWVGLSAVICIGFDVPTSRRGDVFGWLLTAMALCGCAFFLGLQSVELLIVGIVLLGIGLYAIRTTYD